MAFGIIALMLVSGATLMTDSDVTYANGGGGDQTPRFVRRQVTLSLWPWKYPASQI